jgi:hypothetical protein
MRSVNLLQSDTPLDSILVQYGMVPESSHSTAVDEQLVRELWASLDCESRCGLSLEGLKNVVYAIMQVPCEQVPQSENSNNALIEGPGLGSMMPESKPRYGRYVNNEFYAVTEEEAKQLHAVFQRLYLNKISYKPPPPTPPDYSHRPRLTKTTVALAMAMRAKELRQETQSAQQESANGHTPVEKLLTKWQESAERRRAELKAKVEAEQAKDCPFQPNTGRTSSPGALKPFGFCLPFNSDAQTRCLSLYGLSKSNKHKVASLADSQCDRTTAEVEYEQQKSELTFAPQLTQYAAPGLCG